MHSIQFEVKRGESDVEVEGRQVRYGGIHYNGDWSGDVIITIRADEAGPSREIRVPAAAMRRAAAAIVASALVNEAERRGDDLGDRIVSGNF